MSSQRNGTIYIGVTNDLSRRVQQHRNKKVPGFTAKYSLMHLVYYEIFESITVAIRREKQLKKFNREWKLQLIETLNPEWKDLYPSDDNEIVPESRPGSPLSRG